MFRIAALVVSCLALAAVRANAQPIAVPAGVRVRVAYSRENPKDSRQPSVLGTLLAADDSSLVVMPRGTGAAPRLIRIKPAVRLEVHAGHSGSNAGRGALAGLIAGSVVGFALGAAADTECECRMALGGITGLAFGFGGTLIGAGVGASTKRDLWRPVTLPVRVEPRPSK